MRSAPALGYDFGNKRQYRRNIWSAFKRSPYWHPNAQAVLMPSLEGDEIEVAKSKGFKESNLHVVDRNPAIVATLKRRYQRINTYGVELSRATERLPVVTFANLDLCSPTNKNLMQTLDAFAERSIVEEGMIAVTMLRGRETGIFRDIVVEGSRDCEQTTDYMRTATVTTALMALSRAHGERYEDTYPLNVLSVEKTESYKSTAGNQTMLWILMQTHAQPCVCVQCAAYVFEYTEWSVSQWFDRLIDWFMCESTVLLERGLRTTTRMHAHLKKGASPLRLWELLHQIRQNTQQEHDGFPRLYSLASL